MKKLFLLLALASWTMTAAPIVIDGKTNVFAAGQDATPGFNTMGGLFPALAQGFIAGAGQTVRFSVSGLTGCGATGACGAVGASLSFPTGGQTGTDITGSNGLSGIKFTGREMFLVGVFLDASVPSGGGPFTPTFVSTGGTYNADTDTTFTNAGAFFTGQAFYIATQTFLVPTNATRLFLGFADAFDNFVGPWSDYGNNSGSLNVTVSVQNAIVGGVPEPGTIMLVGLGLVGLAYFRKRIV